MKNELVWFNSLDPEDRDIMRRHFISIGSNSFWYATLEEAIRGSVDWESLKIDTVEYFYFHNLLNEAGELNKTKP